MASSADPEDRKDLLVSYQSHATNLRTWLVSYGIGAPVLFLSNKELWSKISVSDLKVDIALLFLLGVFAQILLTALNKTVMWICYRGEFDAGFQQKRIYKLLSPISDWYVIDFIVDLISISLFLVATYFVFNALVSA